MVTGDKGAKVGSCTPVHKNRCQENTGSPADTQETLRAGDAVALESGGLGTNSNSVICGP